MRYYPVPYSTREDIKAVFGLSYREFTMLASGVVAGCVLSLVLFLLTKVFIVIFILTVVPLTTGMAWYLAFKRVLEVDHYETVDRHVWKGILYRLRPHNYINYRR